MIDIDKNKLIKTYGIDDDNFISYLNKFKTLKKIINLGITTAIPVEKLRELYNIFVYYFSLGHDLNTIVNETIANVRSLFFFNGDGYFEYSLPVTDGIEVSKNACAVAIDGRTCHVKIGLVTSKEIPQGTLIFKLAPAPYSECRSGVIWTSNSNDITLIADDNGIRLGNGNIAVNCTISGTFTYVIKK